MKFKVHIYAIVRVPVEVEAENAQEAIKVAEQSCDMHALFNHPEYEYAEDTDGYLVDEIGDDDYLNTTWYDKHGEIDRTMHPEKSSA